MCAQSVPVLEFEIDPLKLCAAPAHTINLKTASRQHGSGTLGMQCLSKALVLLSQPVRGIYQGVCTIGSGVGVRNTPLGAVCSSGPHKTASRQHGSGTLGMQCLSKALVLLSQPVQGIYQGVCTIGSGVGVRNRPLEAMCGSGPHDSSENS